VKSTPPLSTYTKLCTLVLQFSSLTSFDVTPQSKIFPNALNYSTDSTDKNKRIMERLKWRKQSVIARRMEEAFGPDSHALKQPSKKIWRDNMYHRDPPPLLNDQGARGTKRTRSALSGVGGIGSSGSASSTDRTRHVRSRQRKNNNLA
jgi:hypothetical protein